MINIKVLASNKYDVKMAPGLLSDAGTHIKNALFSDDAITHEIASKKKICIVTDNIVAPLYAENHQALANSLSESGFDVYRYIFQGGEEYKNIKTIEGILDYLTEKNFTRSDVLLALGGGITGDVTGFAAAVYLRGIDYIQVPTSLLAIVDSSVGGKTGVNLKAGKNLAGAFWQPKLVLFDPHVLDTLSYDLKLDGIAEAIKAGMIADKSIIDSIKPNSDLNDPVFLMQLASAAINVKKNLVEEDERDSGRRQLLNFGHTIAHAIEKCSNYSIRHGHAVAIGMAVVSTASDNLGWTKEKCSDEIIRILENFGFSQKCPFSPQQITEAAMHDKKIKGEEITLVIPEKIGKCILKTIPTEDLGQFISAGLKD